MGDYFKEAEFLLSVSWIPTILVFIEFIAYFIAHFRNIIQEQLAFDKNKLIDTIKLSIIGLVFIILIIFYCFYTNIGILSLLELYNQKQSKELGNIIAAVTLPLGYYFAKYRYYKENAELTKEKDKFFHLISHITVFNIISFTFFLFASIIVGIIALFFQR